MSKKKTKKTQADSNFSDNPEKTTEVIDSQEGCIEKQEVAKKGEFDQKNPPAESENVAVDLSEVEIAKNILCTCPTCKKQLAENAFKFPGVRKEAINGVFNGVPFQMIEYQRVKCGFCGQVFFMKKYI
jgi:hypothetical protein